MRRRRTPAARALTHSCCALVWLLRAAALLVLVVPIVLVVGLSFARDAYVAIPPSGYSLRWYANIVAERDFLPAFAVSLEVALIVTAVSVSAGTLAACGLYRWDPPRRRWVELALASPVMVPLPMVLGPGAPVTMLAAVPVPVPVMRTVPAPLAPPPQVVP